MISQTTEYALRAIVWLAARPGESIGTGDIAKATRVPPGYLSKVLQMLANGGFVVSRPGRKGGFQLNRSPEDLSILEVINAINPIQRIDGCPLDKKGHESLCPLHRAIDEAAEFVERRFEGVTIAALLKSAPGCGSLPGDSSKRCSGYTGSTIGNISSTANGTTLGPGTSTYGATLGTTSG